MKDKLRKIIEECLDSCTEDNMRTICETLEEIGFDTKEQEWITSRKWSGILGCARIILQKRLAFRHPIFQCGSLKPGFRQNHESDCCVKSWGVRWKISTRKEFPVNKKVKKNIYKPADVFDQFIKEVFGKSPLDEAFKNWNKTTKIIKDKQNETRKSKWCI